MKILFITKEKLNYDEAPASRILNLKRVLGIHHSVYVISRRPSQKIPNNTVIPLESNDFLTNQAYKLVMIFLTLFVIFKHKINYVITREYYYIIILYPFAKLFRFRLIYDMHCFRYKELKTEEKYLKSYLLNLIEPLAHRLADYICAISPGIYEDLDPSLQKKTFLLPNGVLLDDIENTKLDEKVLEKYRIPDTKIIGFVGNWMPWVDVSTLIDASRYITEDYTILIVGEDYAQKAYKSLKGKYSNVIMTGKIPHKEALVLLKRMDICVLPYRKEYVIKHLSIRKTLEYLAAGKPIVMSDSDIGEQRFLQDGINAVKYLPGDAKDLADKAMGLLGSRKLVSAMSKNNYLLSKSFSWEKQVENSELMSILGNYDLYNGQKAPKGTISIIIKALNEEMYIDDCIKSALASLEGLKGEVILVDSLSEDKTVEKAKKYPIKIIQLKNRKERCCGIGPQTGFLCSKGDFIYILDGDMILDKDFIRNALPYFNNPRVAGVGGNIYENTREKLVFQVRSRTQIVDSIHEVVQLGMGGLYRREAILNAGYFSNPYFFAYEEYDLGAELLGKSYKLIRIPAKMVTHHGDETSSFVTLLNRMKSRYLFGSGQYLRWSLKRNRFFKTAFELRIYIFTLIWMLSGLISALSLFWTPNIAYAYIYITLALLLVLAVIKKNIIRIFFSIFSWTMQALGMVVGFFLGAKSPMDYKPEIRTLKNE